MRSLLSIQYIVSLQLRQRNPHFSLFSVFLATQPFNNISPNFTSSFACSASLVHKDVLHPCLLRSSCSFFFYCRDSMIFAADAMSEHQSDISILELHLNDVTLVSLIALPSPPSSGCLSFSISLRVTLELPIFSLYERR